MTRTELWDLLHGRASDIREKCRRDFQKATADVHRLQQHALKLQQMAEDYARQHRTVQAAAHQISQTAELRHTTRQLIALRQRTALELQAALAHQEQCRQRMQRAETEVLKARTLSDKAHRDLARQEAAAQQRRDDANAVGGWLRARTETGS